MANAQYSPIKSWVWGNKDTVITWTFTQHKNYGSAPAKYAGIDIRMTNWPLYAPEGGTVRASYRDSNGAEIICLTHPNGVETQYVHLSSRLVEKGQNVVKGQLIGYSGKSGSVPYHLHFALLVNGVRYDPYAYLVSIAEPIAPNPPVVIPTPPSPDSPPIVPSTPPTVPADEVSIPEPISAPGAVSTDNNTIDPFPNTSTTDENSKIDSKEVIGMLDKKALFEAIKEPLRWLVLGILPFAIAYFVELPYAWAGVTVFILRGIDTYFHEIAPKGEAGGLTRF